MELPVPGYPIGEAAIRTWFRDRYGREATPEEVGNILLGMTARDSTPPSDAPEPGIDHRGSLPPPGPQPQER